MVVFQWHERFVFFLLSKVLDRLRLVGFFDPWNQYIKLRLNLSFWIKKSIEKWGLNLKETCLLFPSKLTGMINEIGIPVDGGECMWQIWSRIYKQGNTISILTWTYVFIDMGVCDLWFVNCSYKSNMCVCIYTPLYVQKCHWSKFIP